MSDRFRLNERSPGSCRKFPAEGFGVEVALAEQRQHGRLLVLVQHCGGAVFVGHAKLFARIHSPGGFEDVDTEEQVGAAVGDGTGCISRRTNGLPNERRTSIADSMIGLFFRRCDVRTLNFRSRCQSAIAERSCFHSLSSFTNVICPYTPPLRIASPFLSWNRTRYPSCARRG